MVYNKGHGIWQSNYWFKLVLVSFVGIISIKISMPMENEKKFGVNNLFSITIVHIAKRDTSILTIYC